MVSRDTAVHAVVVAVAIAALFALNLSFPDLDGSVLTVAVLGCYGLVLGGAHLFLAWSGDDGLVPVASRWRFVGVVAGVVVLGVTSLVTDPVSLGPVSSDAVLTVVAVTGVLGYWALEARSGYAESTSGS
jgi:hypothetical protein